MAYHSTRITRIPVKRDPQYLQLKELRTSSARMFGGIPRGYLKASLTWPHLAWQAVHGTRENLDWKKTSIKATWLSFQRSRPMSQTIAPVRGKLMRLLRQDSNGLSAYPA